MTVPDSSLPQAPGGRPDGPLPRAARPAPRLARPQPKPLHAAEGVPADAESIGSGSATGFVSMLAKRQFDADQLSATPADEAARRERLQVAHEVERGVVVSMAHRAPMEPEPRWHRVMFPLSLVMAAVLLAIGGWAIGALVYMHNVSPLRPQDVHYPLISWRLDVGRLGGYTPASQFMAEAMVLCLPVAGLLVLTAWMLRGGRDRVAG